MRSTARAPIRTRCGSPLPPFPSQYAGLCVTKSGLAHLFVLSPLVTRPPDASFSEPSPRQSRVSPRKQTSPSEKRRVFLQSEAVPSFPAIFSCAITTTPAAPFLHAPHLSLFSASTARGRSRQPPLSLSRNRHSLLALFFLPVNFVRRGISMRPFSLSPCTRHLCRDVPPSFLPPFPPWMRSLAGCSFSPPVSTSPERRLSLPASL